MGFLGVGSAQGVAVLRVSSVTLGKAFTLTEVQVPSPKGGDTESESESERARDKLTLRCGKKFRRAGEQHSGGRWPDGAMAAGRGWLCGLVSRAVHFRFYPSTRGATDAGREKGQI